MKKEVKLYNMIMPLWLLLAMPMWWLPTLAGNFLIDSIVLLILLKIKKKENKKALWKSCILKIWAFGMLSDIIGGAVLIGLDLLLDVLGFHKAASAITLNPWTHPLAVLCVILCMVLSSVFIYIFDSRISFKKAFEDVSERRWFSLAFAIITTPWLFASSIVVW